MSVPPLVSSTPPPPDQCDDDFDEDEFAFQYSESSLSPSTQFEAEKFPFDSTYSEKVKTEIQKPHLSSNNGGDSSSEVNLESSSNYDGNLTTTITTAEKENVKHDAEEENNIEDLDLKLDSLQIDFQNGKVTVEDSLNDTFDNFGTFFGSSALNDSPDTSYYLPKIDDPQQGDAFEKESRSRETLSDTSLSIQNEDSSDADAGPDILHDLTQVSDENVTENNDAVVPSDSPIVADNTSSHSHSDVNYSDATDTPVGTFDCATNNACVSCPGECFCSEGNEVDAKAIDSFVVDWNQNTESKEIHDLCGKEHIQLNTDDYVQSNNDSLKETKLLNEGESSEIDSGLDLYTSFDKKEIINDDDDDMDDFDDFTTFQSGEIKDILNGSLNISQHSSPSIDIAEKDYAVEYNAPTTNETVESVDLKIEVQGENNSVKSLENDVDSDDDFGDFDTYNPVVGTAETEAVKPNVDNDFKLNEFLFANESAESDKFNVALNSIFSRESELQFDSEVDEKDWELKRILGESWSHLINYETEQSYLFSWNNSASQKSLLKSLGIDSRNILFGPKWNVNMPRFAANLGSNPLQPIKHSVNQSTPDQLSEKRLSIVTDAQVAVSQSSKDYNWDSNSNMTNSDFQASSYAESLLLDLEHLMATLDQMTSGQSTHFKISDLFTNACNERGDNMLNVPQSFEAHDLSEEANKVEKPLHPTVLNIGRKINLPDTHIFTPTDSETPWSHTIHYDEGYDNFHNSSTSTDAKNVCDPIPADDLVKNITKQSESFDDFDDFQCHKVENNTVDDTVNVDIKNDNFKIDPVDVLDVKMPNVGRSDTLYNTAPVNVMLKEQSDDFGDFQSAGVEFSSYTKFPNTNLLEPVKISPMAPVVNWPSPGKVKSSDFDDFSDMNNVTFPQINSNVNSNSTDLTFPPNLPLGPTKFILKESKIVSDVLVVDNGYVEPIQSFVSEKQSNTNQPQTSRADFQFEHFTDFISNPKDQTFVPRDTVDSNTSTSVANDESNLDDFDDFQSANVAPISNNFPIKETPSLSILDNEMFNKPKNDIKPVNYNTHSYDKFTLEPVSVRRQPVETVSKNTSQQILQPLSLENFSQINWPNPGMDIQDLARFNPVNSIKSYSEPKDNLKTNNSNVEQSNDDDGWSDFVSTKPVINTSVKPVMPNMMSCNGFGISNPTNSATDDSEDWSDFVSSTVPSKNTNELKTISQNIHSQSNVNNPSYGSYKSANVATKPKTATQNNVPSNVNVLPNLTYISPKTNMNRHYNSHFQNL